MSNNDNKVARDALKRRLHGLAYGHFANKSVKITEQLAELGKYAQIGKDVYTEFLEAMKQQWIIDGEWSAYHSMIAQNQGWGLTQKGGMWQVVTLDSAKFPTDEDARLHVLAHECDQDSSLCAIAVQAVIIGNIKS